MSADDYQILSEAGDQSVQLTFRGELEGEAILWSCEFVTLQEEYQRLCLSSNTEIHSPIRCFIEIDVVDVSTSLRVGLNIPLINASAIEKMILMVRNYKYLRQGRHDFGDFYPAK